MQKVCVPIIDQDMQKVDFSRHWTLFSHVLEHAYQNECKLKIQMWMHHTHPQTCSQAHTNTFICMHADTQIGRLQIWGLSGTQPPLLHM